MLIHPNTEEDGVKQSVSELRDHTQRATWMGDRIPLDLTLFERKIAKETEAEKKQS